MVKKNRTGLGQGGWNKALSIILVLAVLSALGAIGYASRASNKGEKFTEFYILGLEGQAGEYPSRLAVGEEGQVILGIYNREYETVTYRIEVKIDGIVTSRLNELIIGSDER